jgi:2,4-diketo-3-deoxy-L-fuconate hydrolase
MKLLRYGLPGCERPGLLDANHQIRDLSGLVRDIAEDALLPESLERLRRIDASALPRVNDSVRIGACVGRVGKILCIGLNYSDHVAEAGASVPSEPVLFMKAISAICGPNDDVMIPRDAKKADWEVELGVVIGKPAKYIEERDPFSCSRLLPSERPVRESFSIGRHGAVG